MQQDYNKKQKNVKKMLDTLRQISIIDNKLEKKYNRHNNDIIFYDNLLEQTNNNFFIIIKNLT